MTQTFPANELTLEDKKCGFQIVTDAKSNFDSFTPEQQANVQKILSRPVLDTSMVSPSGFFRIHYDTNNLNGNLPSYVSNWSVEQNVNEVAKALDSSYRFEIGYLGFLPPVGDNGAGEDDKYDVYIQNQGAGLYGYTVPEVRVGNVNWASYLVIDNNYIGYYSSGINGMLVTVAHEFHHGVQVGNYAVPSDVSPYRDEDVFFYELTSTSMEEFVFDSVNDYYAYMQSYFNRPDRSMPSNNGYNLAIWNLFLVESLGNSVGFPIIKRQWELIPSMNAILTINKTLLDDGYSFQGELNKFGIYTYYTNVRANLGPSFQEAASYPLIVPTATFTFYPPELDTEGWSYPTGNHFIKFSIASSGDSLYAIVTNGDASAALINPNQTIHYNYNLYSNASGERQLTEEYSSTFTTNNPSNWAASEIYNNVLVRSDSMLIPNVKVDGSLAFPNPYRYSSSGGSDVLGINIALNLQSGKEVDFNVYTSGLKEVYAQSKTVGILLNNLVGIYWDGLDNNGGKLATGVYIYVVKQGDEVIKGKVVIFNE